MSTSFVRTGVGVIIVRDNKVLLGLRKSSHGAGTWSCPGGHVEFGETIRECSIRETLEETGLNINVIDNHFDWNEKFWEEEQKHYITIYSLASIDDDAEPTLVEPEKCEIWKWFTADELDSITLMEQDKMKLVLKQAIKESGLSQIKETMKASDVTPGARIEILSGSCEGQFGTVLLNPNSAMIKVQIEGREEANLISKDNDVRIVSSS